MLSIQVFSFNPFQENTYVLFDETGEAVVVDAGCYGKAEEQQLAGFIAQHKLQVKYLLNTHSHIDHVLGSAFVKHQYKVPLLIHPLDEATLRSAKIVSSHYGIPNYNEVTHDQYLNEGDVVSFGNQQLGILFLPGHAPGHIAFYNKEDKSIFAGDVLFKRSIGRTDLPGGNFDTLIESIHRKLFVLPDNVVVYPGHGPATTIGEEKVSNPYCALTLN